MVSYPVDIFCKNYICDIVYAMAKNGIYISLVNDVRHAFEGSILVKIDCRGLEPSDYKKIGAKLKELVPCVLLSFDDEQILMWRGHNWKSMYPLTPPTIPSEVTVNDSESNDDSHTQNSKTTISSPRMMSLWKRAIQSNKAMLLEEIELGPDSLLEKVEEFERVNQLTEHSYPAVLLSSANPETVEPENETNEDYDDYYDDYDDPFEDAQSNVPPGSLPVDFLARRLEGE